MTFIRGAILLVLMLCVPVASAQIAGTSEQARGGGYAPLYVPCIKLANGKCEPVSATNPMPVTGGGGGGGGDASAANQATQIAAEQAIRDRIGDTASPAVGSVNARLGSLTASIATAGGSAPTTGQSVTGSDGTNARILRTDARGGLVPAQGVVASTRTTINASAATSISAAAAGRIGLSVQVEAALTANLYLCTTQATACSATSYDALIPSGAGAGTVYTFVFAPSTQIYAFSTATPVVVANSWAAP